MKKLLIMLLFCTQIAFSQTEKTIEYGESVDIIVEEITVWAEGGELPAAITFYQLQYKKDSDWIDVYNPQLRPSSQMNFNGGDESIQSFVLPDLGQYQIRMRAVANVASNPVGERDRIGEWSDILTVNVAAPNIQITEFSPVSGKPGDTITIRGLNLFGVSSVKFGSVEAASFTTLTDGQGIVRIEAVVPENSPAQAFIVATRTINGTPITATSPLQFTTTPMTETRTPGKVKIRFNTGE